MPLVDRIRSRLLNGMAEGQAADTLLGELCAALQRALPGTIVGVTFLDRSRRSFAGGLFPSLDPSYAEALRGIAVEDRPGSCALAVFEGRTVTSLDIKDDARFSDGWKALSMQHGMEALVSIPAAGTDGLLLGTLVVAFPPASQLDDEQLALADAMAELTGLALAYRRTQLRQELLVGELQHRVRNLFSTIGAVVYATLKAYPDPGGFRKVLDGRLAALAKAHSLALEPQNADLRSLLTDMLAPFSIDHAVSLEGPRLMLSQEAAVALSLAVHELATNATKYGAFSQQNGSVSVRWGVQEGTAENRFGLEWQERGGPRVHEPQHLGYGQRTIKSSVAAAFDGTVEMVYHPEGLQCQIHAPLSERLGERVN